MMFNCVVSVKIEAEAKPKLNVGKEGYRNQDHQRNYIIK